MKGRARSTDKDAHLMEIIKLGSGVRSVKANK